MGGLADRCVGAAVGVRVSCVRGGRLWVERACSIAAAAEERERGEGEQEREREREKIMEALEQ